MKALYRRRNFIKTSAAAGIGLGMSGSIIPFFSKGFSQANGKRVGIIGLDTSHCVAFTKEMNSFNEAPQLKGYKVKFCPISGGRRFQIQWAEGGDVGTTALKGRNQIEVRTSYVSGGIMQLDREGTQSARRDD